jgi:hypothetical protein
MADLHRASSKAASGVAHTKTIGDESRFGFTVGLHGPAFEAPLEIIVPSPDFVITLQ